MNNLNRKNEKTKHVIHLLVTSLCQRNCKYCCNKQYNLNDIPYVTNKELKDALVLCITGGEPFLFANPSSIATYYKNKYGNIKKIFVYTNAIELFHYLVKGGKIIDIDGLNISIKTKLDAKVFESCIKTNEEVTKLDYNRLYVFDNLYTENPSKFKVIHREWQPNFKPANDSIFRKI